MLLKNLNRECFLDTQTAKINRSVKLIKGFMALVIFMFLLQYYQTRVLDFGAFAGSAGVLSLLRGILLSPSFLSTQVKYWSSSNFTVSKASYSYFILAFVLILVSAF
jgi:hypothetical protein